MLGRLLVVALGAGVAIAVYARLAPSDPNVWHVDPSGAEPGRGRFVVGPSNPQPDTVYPGPPEAALAAFDAVALAQPRTERLAGGPASGRTTYVSRSLVFGFPDYTTVSAVAVPGGAQFVIFARLRFGVDDLGVNAARVRHWLEAVSAQ